MGSMSADRLGYTTRWRVRTYELDMNGHVNNAVYLNWAEQLATGTSRRPGSGGRGLMPGTAPGWSDATRSPTGRRQSTATSWS